MALSGPRPASISPPVRVGPTPAPAPAPAPAAAASEAATGIAEGWGAGIANFFKSLFSAKLLPAQMRSYIAWGGGIGLGISLITGFVGGEGIGFNLNTLQQVLALGSVIFPILVIPAVALGLIQGARGIIGGICNIFQGNFMAGIMEIAGGVMMAAMTCPLGRIGQISQIFKDASTTSAAFFRSIQACYGNRVAGSAARAVNLFRNGGEGLTREAASQAARRAGDTVA